MYAKTMSEEEALEWLEETLTEGAKPKLTPAEKKAAAAPTKVVTANTSVAAKPAAKSAVAAKPATARKTVTAKPAAKKTAGARH
jgi:hypothetical protein